MSETVTMNKTKTWCLHPNIFCIIMLLFWCTEDVEPNFVVENVLNLLWNNTILELISPQKLHTWLFGSYVIFYKENNGGSLC